MYIFFLTIYFILFNCILVEERYLNLNLYLNLYYRCFRTTMNNVVFARNSYPVVAPALRFFVSCIICLKSKLCAPADTDGPCTLPE